MRNRRSRDMMELAQAILDDGDHRTKEVASEILDEESGKLLKY